MVRSKKEIKMELGSEFEIDFENLSEAEDNIFNYLKGFRSIYTSNGRMAIGLLLPVLKEGVILLPEYICESVIEVFKNRFEIRFYRVTRNLTISLDSLEDKIDSKVSAIYLMHYFGRLQPAEVTRYLQQKKKRYGFQIIEDTTHSVFTDPCTIGDYCVCSIRKCFPVPDGGVLYGKDEMQKITEGHLKQQWSIRKIEAMVLKKYYLNCGMEANSIYRDIFEKEEQCLDDDTDPKKISDISKSLLLCYSVADMKKKRIENYRFLEKQTFSSKYKVFSDNLDFTPFSFPVYVEKRDDFKSYLMEHRIFCAVHWPYISDFEGTGAEDIAAHILSLPIDQRYGQKHMEYMIQIINEYKGRQKNGTYNDRERSEVE